MDMTGERRIPAPRETVWQALNDPEVLKASIPGCESLEKLSDTDMKATATVRIGPISARFAGNVHLADIDPPHGYTISGEGEGGVAGFAKGGAKVHLADDGACPITELRANEPARRGRPGGRPRARGPAPQNRRRRPRSRAVVILQRRGELHDSALCSP